MAPPDSFMSRWSRRKVAARQAEAAPIAPAAPAVAATPAPEPAGNGAASFKDTTVPAGPAGSTPADPGASTPHGSEPAAPCQPTLADVEQLGHESDYTRFVSADVSPEVRNAALKKLFTDPHFNVMDGLDTYIEDYGIPNPIDPAMLRLMSQTQFLGLFTDEVAPEDNAATASPLPATPLPATNNPAQAQAPRGPDVADVPPMADPTGNPTTDPTQTAAHASTTAPDTSA